MCLALALTEQKTEKRPEKASLKSRESDRADDKREKKEAAATTTTTKKKKQQRRLKEMSKTMRTVE